MVVCASVPHGKAALAVGFQKPPHRPQHRHDFAVTVATTSRKPGSKAHTGCIFTFADTPAAQARCRGQLTGRAHQRKACAHAFNLSEIVGLPLADKAR